jgi:hypothetical protein
MASLCLFLSAKAVSDNEIEFKQVNGGDDLVLDIIQSGYDNLIKFSVDHDNNNFLVRQSGPKNTVSWVDWWGSGYGWGGDVDGTGNVVKLYQNCTKALNCNTNKIGMHIYGNDNTFWWGQGYYISDRNDTTWTWDNAEGGGHTVNIDIHGVGNSIKGFQRNCASGVCDGHTARIYSYADNNDVFTEQVHDGSKVLYLTMYNDDNVVDTYQEGYADHTATVILNGTEPTDLDLIQKGNSNQTYSLSQTCYTAGGCAIQITQQ